MFTFDMFLVYDLNNTHSWCGYQVNRVKFRRFLPKLNTLCSAELLNHKYMIPCDPVSYLDKEYGPGWRSPQSKNYTWSNVQYWKNWSDIEWPKAVKYYDKYGALLKPKILRNQLMKKKYLKTNKIIKLGQLLRLIISHPSDRKIKIVKKYWMYFNQHLLHLS